MTNLREKIRRGPIIGSWINTASPVAAEIMAAAGFDYLVVDAEHAAVTLKEVRQIFQAIAAGNPRCAPMVRMPGNCYDETKRYLDAGAAGVIAPLICSAEETVRLVRSAKYPPVGDRGVGFGRAHGYGFDFDEYMARANDETFVCAQIEHIDAVRNLESILAVEGVDAALIGPYDLSASMRRTARFDHPEFLAARRTILDTCIARGVAAGIHVVQPDPHQAAARIEEGFGMIAYSLDITMLGTACRHGLSSIRTCVTEKSGGLS
jgi:2-dehydro-3-deoxyglucarate aldolase